MKNPTGSYFSLFIFGIFLAAALLGAVGCDDDPAAPIPEAEEFLATTPDSLVAMFRTALIQGDGPKYVSLFSEDFRHLLGSPLVKDFILPATGLTRAETVKAGLAMFAGEPVENVYSETVPGVTRIQVSDFVLLSDWAETGASEPYPGSVKASYQTDITVFCGEEEAAISANCPLVFYATAIDTTLADGTETQRYLLVRMEDDVFDKSAWNSCPSATRVCWS